MAVRFMLASLYAICPASTAVRTDFEGDPNVYHVELQLMSSSRDLEKEMQKGWNTVHPASAFETSALQQKMHLLEKQKRLQGNKGGIIAMEVNHPTLGNREYFTRWNHFEKEFLPKAIAILKQANPEIATRFKKSFPTKGMPWRVFDEEGMAARTGLLQAWMNGMLNLRLGEVDFNSDGKLDQAKLDIQAEFSQFCFTLPRFKGPSQLA